jgi:hypothetical protein
MAKMPDEQHRTLLDRTLNLHPERQLQENAHENTTTTSDAIIMPQKPEETKRGSKSEPTVRYTQLFIMIPYIDRHEANNGFYLRSMPPTRL